MPSPANITKMFAIGQKEHPEQFFRNYQTVLCPVDSATVIEFGDLLYLDSDDAKPASSQSDAGTEAANQEAFHDLFLGVALDDSPAGVASDIRVAIGGLWEFDCPSSTFELGALIGASENGAGSGLLDQQVEGCATANLSIGRCAKRVNPAGTRVIVDIVSTIMHGGPQTAA